VVLVFILTLVAIASGVGTTGVESLRDQSIFAWIYYAGGLFVFGGLDLGVPAGGPAWGRMALWAAYLMAPVITTTAVIEALVRILRPGGRRGRKLENHVILVGAGPVGLAYLAAIRSVEPEKVVLLLDHLGSLVNTTEVEELGGVEVLQADARRPATLGLLAMERADRMIVVTDDDLVNLDVAWGAKESCPALPVAVHVADLSLLRPVNRMVRDRVREAAPGVSQPLVFNTHRIGALHLYERSLHPHFQETAYRDVVVLVGFGRFAQTILELLRVTAPDEIARVLVVDTDAGRLLRQFEADVSLDAIPHSAVDGDPEDPGTWDRVSEELGGMDGDPIYLLASSDEVVNFRAAMLLRAREAEALIFARCFHRGRFAESLAAQRRFQLLAFDEVLRDALVEHYEGLRTVE
jgi:Trk K+ transport system NAD-binding subunit